MRRAPRFGGEWTETKLEMLDKYLRAYCTIFEANERARFYKRSYLDAFAGTGSVQTRSEPIHEDFFEGMEEPDAQAYVAGSASRALNLSPGFHDYIFVEKDPTRALELEKLSPAYDGARVTVISADANEYVQHWCADVDWQANRACLFLDPFGMEVEWPTIEAIGATGGVDMWFWFPIMGVLRHLTKNEPPPPDWQARITRTFGTAAWIDRFYNLKMESHLFGDELQWVKEADIPTVVDFVRERLDAAFPGGVARNPRLFRNSKDVPLYLFCFASAARNATALKIAEHLLGKG